MAVNLNDLPLEAADAVVIDWDHYQDPQEFAPPIPEGTYSLKVVKAEIEKFDQKTGVVSFILDHEAFDNATGAKVGAINFDHISTKVFNRGNPPVPASMAADMLRACVGQTERPASPRQWGEQITALKAWSDQGNTWSGVVQWDGYCSHKGTQFETQVDADKKQLPVQQSPHAAPFAPRGEKQWPLLTGANGTGAHNPVMACPTCGQDVQARAKVNRRIPHA